jgi:integrase
VPADAKKLYYRIELRFIPCGSATPVMTQLKKKGMKWNGWHAFRRGLASNLHEMGVPTKVIQRVCRHADEATTKKHYIHATEPGVRSGMRKLEASITREKNERR